MLFVIPWGTHWIIGTTDTDWDLDKAHPAASRADIDYLLEHVNTVLADPLTHDDVEGVYAGLRPLLAGESRTPTSKLSREHAVGHPAPGLVVIAGGKYTTYRVMAKDAVDAAVRRLRPAGAPASCTEHVAAARRRRATARCGTGRQRLASDIRPARRPDRAPAAPLRLADRRAARADRDRSRAGASRCAGAEDYLRAEAVYAATHEGALHLDDVLARRTRISIETCDRGVRQRPRRRASSWATGSAGTPTDAGAEVEHYLQRVRAELESQRQPDDRTADATRRAAPEIVTVG